jgi:hypothetical protein
MKFFLLILKNLRRNVARTAITGLALAVLVMIAILIGAVFTSLDQLTSFPSQHFKMVVRSRWRIPSRIPLAYLEPLSRGAASGPEDLQPEDWLAWQFYNGTLDPEKFTPESHVVLIAVDPGKIRTMMEDLDTLDPELVAKMRADRRGVLLAQAGQPDEATAAVDEALCASDADHSTLYQVAYVYTLAAAQAAKEGGTPEHQLPARRTVRPPSRGPAAPGRSERLQGSRPPEEGHRSRQPAAAPRLPAAAGRPGGESPRQMRWEQSGDLTAWPGARRDTAGPSPAWPLPWLGLPSPPCGPCCPRTP